MSDQPPDFQEYLKYVKDLSELSLKSATQLVLTSFTSMRNARTPEDLDRIWGDIQTGVDLLRFMSDSRKRWSPQQTEEEDKYIKIVNDYATLAEKFTNLAKSIYKRDSSPAETFQAMAEFQDYFTLYFSMVPKSQAK